MEKAEGKSPPSKTCGSCRRVGADLKTCTACRTVHYCDVSCQKAHRKAHKKRCKEIAHTKEVMEEFKANPMTEECPICMMRLPLLASEYVYQSCCGMVICDGCIVASQKAQGLDLTDGDVPCAFCRRRVPSSPEELVERLNKRIDKYCDSMAVFNMAGVHEAGTGVPKNFAKAFEYSAKASDMGNAHAMHNVAYCSWRGIGVPNDEKKAKIYFEMAAKKGHVQSLVQLSDMHIENNLEVRILYIRLAAESGQEEAMEFLKNWYRLNTDDISDHSGNCICIYCRIQKTKGLLTKDDLANTIRAFHSAQEELRSDERDLAREHRKK